MFSTIDKEIFRFLDLLEKKQLQGMPDSTKGMVGAEIIADLGPVQDFKIIQTDPSGSNVTAYHDVNGVLVGLSNENYSKFKELISTIQELPPFDSKSSFLFIEEKSYEWLLDVYRQKKAEKSLSAFLLDCVENDHRLYTFYLPIEPLAIQSSFTIGNVEVSFLTDELLQKEEEKFIRMGNPKEEFKKFINPFLNKAIAISSAHGVFDKAKQKAFRNAEMSVNVLKCFLHAYAIYNQFKIPDLNYRQKASHMSAILHSFPSEQSTLESLTFNNHEIAVIEINNKTLKEFKQRKFGKFSDFLIQRKETEFYYAVSSAIVSFSKYVSTQNSYDKTVKLISFFESVLINAKTKNGNGESILKKQLMPKLLKSKAEIELGIELTGNFYRIRDAYVHHGIEKLIDHKKLYQFQTIAFRFITELIELNNKMNTIDEFYAYLQMPNEVKL